MNRTCPTYYASEPSQTLIVREASLWLRQFVCEHPPDVTRVAFQNCGPQPQLKYAHKARGGSASIEAGSYDIILVAEHSLNPAKLDPQQGWHDRMCMSARGTYFKLSYNTNDGPDTPWNQYEGTGITVNTNLKSRMSDKRSDPIGFGRWTWVRIEGKAGEATVFVSAYRPCKNTLWTLTVWNQQV